MKLNQNQEYAAPVFISRKKINEGVRRLSAKTHVLGFFKKKMQAYADQQRPD